MLSPSAKKRSVEELQRDSSGTVYSDERILLHLQQVNDLALELLSDVFNFRLVDQSNGMNEDSVNECALTLREFMEHEVKIRSTVIRSKKIYAEVKSLYMSMQDVKTYLGQAMRMPTTTSKDIFINPFKTISAKMKVTFKALLGAVLAEINSMRAPNSTICAAQYQLGVTHMYGLDGKPQNYVLAVDKFQEAADQGNTDAMVMLARCHLHGQGVERNETTGLEWLTRAANSRICPQAKDELAMLIIGNLREASPSCIKDYCASLLGDDNSTIRSQNRHSTSRNVSFKSASDEEDDTTYGVEDAIKLLLSAAADGCVDAKSHLGSIYEEAGDLEQAATWYTQASEEGCAKGTYLLGHLYLKGKLNASKTKTFNLLKQAARGGQTDAFYALGTCYETGIGVEINLDLALQNYRISANGGSKIGMYSLGYLLVQNAIEMRKRIKHMRPYAATAHARSHTGTAVVMQNNPDDELIAELREEAEATLQEGIHWLRAASENHIKDAAFQLGRLYEQAIGVPDDSFAALANYKWAAHLGHTRAAFYAGNLLYAHANSRNIHSVSEAAMFYHQAALGGIVEAMNSYAILLEDGRASEMGLKDLHLAAAWFYQACIETERLEKAYINLAMLLISTPLGSFRTIPGDIVTLADAKDFLLDFFESDAYTDNDRREVILQMIDEIDENSKTALPLVEEVSLSLVAPRRNNRAAGRYDQQNRERSNSGAASKSSRSQSKRGGNKEHKLEVDADEHEEIEVNRIPSAANHNSRSTAQPSYRTNRVVHEEVHKLNRGPIQNVGISYNHAYSEEKLSPPRGTSPPAHVQAHRAGELYSTDGPVIPPSFVPRATQYAAPEKSDKPQPRTKTTPGFTASYDGLELQHPDSLINPHDPSAVPSVPVLASPTRKQNAPPKPPRSRETSDEFTPPSAPQAQSQVKAQRAPPAQAAQPRVQPTTQRVATASSSPRAVQHEVAGAENPAAEVHAKHATRRLSFISGLVNMMGKKDKEGASREGSATPVRTRAPTAAPAATTSVPFQAPARDDSARRSVDSLNPPKKTSMWKSVKNATKTSSSVDYNNSTISAPLPDRTKEPMPTFPSTAGTSAPGIPANATLPPPKPARSSSFGNVARGVMGSRSESPAVNRDVPRRSESPSVPRVNSPDADDSSRRSLDSHGQPKKSSMWKSIKNATTSKSVDYSSATISAPLDAPQVSQPNAHLATNTTGGNLEPPKKPSRMSFSGIASSVTGNRSRSASPAVSRDVPLREESPSAFRVNSPDADDSSRRSLDTNGQPKKSSMWQSMKNATTSKSVDYSSSAQLDTSPVSQPTAGAAQAQPHRTAMGMFASEPVPVPSPPKPPKPQFVAQNSAQQLQNQGLNAAPGLNDLSLGSAGSAGSVGGAGAYLNSRTNSVGLPDPRQGGYPPLPTDTQSVPTVGNLPSGSLAGQRAAGVAQQTQVPQNVPSSGASDRSSSPEKKKSNSLMAKFMTNKHKKYLTKDPVSTSSTAAAANSSTGTVDSLVDAPALNNHNTSNVGDARRAASQQSHQAHSMVSEFDEQGYHTEEEEDEAEPLGVSDAFEPLSDLSMSSRDIRR